MSDINEVMAKVIAGIKELATGPDEETFQARFQEFANTLPEQLDQPDTLYLPTTETVPVEERLAQLEEYVIKTNVAIETLEEDDLILDNSTQEEPYEVEYGVLQDGPVDEELYYISVKPSSSDGVLNTDLREIAIATFSDGGPGWVTLAADAVVTFVRLERTRTITSGTNRVYGQLLSNLQNAQISAGAIMLWSGEIVNIPTGWALCDGTGDTPDLTERFVLGAKSLGGVFSTVGCSGGLAEHNHTSHDWNHSHSIARGPYQTDSTDTVDVNSVLETGNVSSYADLSHSNSSNIPPYYALAYIMKL